MPKYKTIQEASKAAISLDIKSKTQYQKVYKRDKLLPSTPSRTYKEDWVSFDKFLGKKTKDFYPTMEEASKAAISLDINNQKEYQKNYKKDTRLPSTPAQFYKEDWVNFVEFLGRETKNFYPTIKEASKAAITLGFNRTADYLKNYKQDARLPASPNEVYKEYWAAFGAWCGFLGNETKDFYSTIHEASNVVVALGITSKKEYLIGYRQDARLPASPNKVYREYWEDFGSWRGFLGKEKKDYYLTIEEASKAAISLGINSSGEYLLAHKKDQRLPAHPKTVYKDSWLVFDTWYGFLGNDKKIFYSTIQEASKAAIALGINSCKEYEVSYRKDERLPAYPNSVYKSDWADFGFWYGFLEKEKKEYYPTIEEASKAVIALDIRSRAEYLTGYTKDERLPSNPNQFYKEDWVEFDTWYGFLGNEKKYFYSTVEEASRAAISLQIRSETEYQIAYKQDTLLPANPNTFYKVGWEEFGGL